MSKMKQMASLLGVTMALMGDGMTGFQERDSPSRIKFEPRIIPLTNKQKKVRIRNKIARKSRQINRKRA